MNTLLLTQPTGYIRVHCLCCTFLGFGKCIVTCTYHDSIIQNGIILECSSAYASSTQDHVTGLFMLLCVHQTLSGAPAIATRPCDLPSSQLRISSFSHSSLQAMLQNIPDMLPYQYLSAMEIDIRSTCAGAQSTGTLNFHPLVLSDSP